MQLFGRVGVVVDVDDDGPPFLEAQQRSRKLPVIERGRHDVVRRQFDEAGSDADRIVSLLCGRLPGEGQASRHRADERDGSGGLQQCAAIEGHGSDTPWVTEGLFRG